MRLRSGQQVDDGDGFGDVPDSLVVLVVSNFLVCVMVLAIESMDSRF